MSLTVSQITGLFCLLNRLFGRRSKKTSKLRVTGLCEGNSPVTLTFVRGIHRSPVNSPHKRPVRRKMFPFDDAFINFQKTPHRLDTLVHEPTFLAVIRMPYHRVRTSLQLSGLAFLCPYSVLSGRTMADSVRCLPICMLGEILPSFGRSRGQTHTESNGICGRFW